MASAADTGTTTHGDHTWGATRLERTGGAITTAAAAAGGGGGGTGPAGPAGPTGPVGPAGPNGSINLMSDVSTTGAAEGTNGNTTFLAFWAGEWVPDTRLPPPRSYSKSITGLFDGTGVEVNGDAIVVPDPMTLVSVSVFVEAAAVAPFNASTAILTIEVYKDGGAGNPPILLTSFNMPDATDRHTVPYAYGTHTVNGDAALWVKAATYGGDDFSLTSVSGKPLSVTIELAPYD